MHLRASPSELGKQLAALAAIHLTQKCATPIEHTERTVSWLELENASGFLERAYVTATLMVAVSDTEVWSWLVNPHGVAHVTRKGMSFVSTDLRYPVLRALGAMKAAPSPGTPDVLGETSSVWCVGTRDGYERIRTLLESDEAVLAFDRASLPFGPCPRFQRRLARSGRWTQRGATASAPPL